MIYFLIPIYINDLVKNAQNELGALKRLQDNTYTDKVDLMSYQKTTAYLYFLFFPLFLSLLVSTFRESCTRTG